MHCSTATTVHISKFYFIVTYYLKLYWVKVLSVNVCSWCCLGALIGICVPSMAPMHRGRPLCWSKPSITSCSLSLVGHWIKWGVILFTTASHILVGTLNTVEHVTSNLSDTDLIHSGLPRYHNVMRSCFSRSIVGRPLSLGTGISGQFPKSLTSFWAVDLESLKCWRKEESETVKPFSMCRNPFELQHFCTFSYARQAS